MLIVPSCGRKGGLALFWKDQVSVELISFSNHHIHVKVILYGSTKPWWVTGFYGHPKTHSSVESRTLMTQLNPRPGHPWCIMGDFNEITCFVEKWGGRQAKPSNNPIL